VHADPAVLARLLAMARPRPEWTALDLATGAGHTALALAPHVRRIIGFDLTREMLAQAAALAREAGRPGLALCQGDAHHLPFPSQSFDLVTCRRGAHHFADLPRALGEMRRLLRPGGRLAIDDRSAEAREAAELMNRLDRLHDPSRVREHSPRPGASSFATPVSLSGDRALRAAPAHALTGGVEPQAAREIERLADEIEPRLAEAFGRAGAKGYWSIRHWFVMLAARPA
jgi:ubiquinone/menaquinone biosynthesis C-methylase UbiE